MKSSCDASTSPFNGSRYDFLDRTSADSISYSNFEVRRQSNQNHHFMAVYWYRKQIKLTHYYRMQYSMKYSNSTSVTVDSIIVRWTYYCWALEFYDVVLKRENSLNSVLITLCSTFFHWPTSWGYILLSAKIECLKFYTHFTYITYILHTCISSFCHYLHIDILLDISKIGNEI